MRGSLALITIMFWMIIPLFWIPLHSVNKVFKKLGMITYLMPLIPWLPLAYLVYHFRTFLLRYTIDLPAVVNIVGAALLISGTLLHIRTIRLLGRGIIGLPEVLKGSKGYLVTTGPFSATRHPTYFAHTLMFSGVFLITGVIATALVTLLDLVIVNAVIIPLEERELLSRFGEEYRIYRERVPPFFPRWSLFL